MATLSNEQVRGIISYSTSIPYFDKMTPAALHDAYGQIKTSSSWDKPKHSVTIRIGDIDGDVICNALWKEMSLNPVRFGMVSPFVFNGKNDIYRFCKTNIADTSTPQGKLLGKIRHNLIAYMTLNKTANNSWRDHMLTMSGGTINIFLDADGSPNKQYKMLAKLNASVHAIASQNLKDFRLKRFRHGIVAAVSARYPNGTRKGMTAQIAPVSVAPQPVSAPVIDEECRLDEMAESAQITLDNAQYVSGAQFEQAQQDLDLVKSLRDARTY